jgi:integrase
MRLVARTANVERAVARGGLLKGTKTEAARTVDLTPRLAAALDQWQAQQEAAALAAGREAPALVFPSDERTPLDDIGVAKRFQAILVRAALPKFNLYCLRHSYASHLLAMGAPITYVAAQLGHAKPTTTLAHYAHWLPRGDHGLAAKLEALRTQTAAVEVAR